MFYWICVMCIIIWAGWLLEGSSLEWHIALKYFNSRSIDSVKGLFSILSKFVIIHLLLIVFQVILTLQRQYYHHQYMFIAPEAMWGYRRQIKNGLCSWITYSPQNPEMTHALWHKTNWFWLPISLPRSGTSHCCPSCSRTEPKIHINKRVL